jgi:hypothetical protein
MKLTMLASLIVLAVGTAFAQDTTATPVGNFYVDSLKSAAYPATTGNGSPRDTVDVVVSSMAEIDYYNVSVYSTSADTLVVSALSSGSSQWVQHSVVSLATGATVTSMVTSTTTVDYVVAGGSEISKLRFTSPGTTNAIYFVVSGRKGLIQSVSAANQIISSSIKFKRPNNSTAYSASDVVSDSGSTAKLRKWANVVDYDGRQAQIVSALLMADTITATNGTFRLHLFGDSTNWVGGYAVAPIADHAQFTLKDTSKSVYVGYIDFTLVAGGTASTMCVAQNTAPAIYFTTSRYRSLWGVLVASAAYVPREYGTLTLVLTVKY